MLTRSYAMSPVIAVLLYAADTWMIKKEDEGRLLSYEMRCYRNMLKIQWHQKVTNNSIR